MVVLAFVSPLVVPGSTKIAWGSTFSIEYLLDPFLKTKKQ